MRVPRRTFFAGFIATVLAALPLAAVVQERLPVIGLLATSTPEGAAFWVEERIEALAGLGWVMGRDYEFVSRYANGVRDPDTMRALADELVALEPDVIITAVGIATLAADRATTTIPIVGYVPQSMVDELEGDIGRPEGNVTGWFRGIPAQIDKRIELAKDVLPGISRVGYLDFTLATSRDQRFESAAGVAAALGVTLIRAEVTTPEDIVPAVQKLVEEEAEALTTSGGVLFIPANQDLFLQPATAAGLPVFGGGLLLMQAGALASYSSDNTEAWRAFSEYIIRILEGAKVVDLPVVIPTEVNLTINLNTARNLGIEFPPNILALADVIIELEDEPEVPAEEAFVPKVPE